jgi:hypothetical protein
MASDDALGLFQQMRPPSPALSPEIRRASGNLPAGAPDLHSLAMVPGTPGYNARIPKPPCYMCGEDHHANMTYNHAWEPEPVHDEPVSASAIMRRPALDVVEPAPANPLAASPQQRVALYVGRGDTYVVSVETAPDWDATETFKATEGKVLPLIWMARALGVKVVDKTGGDLLMLEQEHGGSQPAQDNVRGAEGPGDREPRRQGPDAHRAKKDKPGEGSSAPG